MSAEKLIAKLLRYSLEPVKWQFSALSAWERAIVDGQENLDKVHDWVELHDPQKRFTYFESTEGGMEEHIVLTANDLSFLRGWMERDDDLDLSRWMETAQVGEMYGHRLGTLVRNK